MLSSVHQRRGGTAVVADSAGKGVVTPDLAELRRLADEATPGPWQVESCGCCVYTEPGLRIAEADAGSDTRFIAAARSAVPVLCAEVDRLRGLLDRCETALATVCDDWRYGQSHIGNVARLVLAELRPAPADQEIKP